MVDLVPVDHDPFADPAPGGRDPQGWLSRAGDTAMDYMRWNLTGSPGFTPGEIGAGMAKSVVDTGTRMTTPPPQLPAEVHDSDMGLVVKQNGQWVPWKEADPRAAGAYYDEIQSRADLPMNVALGMVGGGANFAERGALGAAGAKMVQPVAEATEAAQPGIRAYHGSPHDFDAFDISKIGTGEGAQAYGHGLYFAENEAVAKEYRDALKRSRSKLPDDVISLPPDMRQAVTTHARTDADAATAAKRAQWMSANLRGTDVSKVEDMIQRVRDAERGRMYEVNIAAHPDQFLDWDKPLPKDHRLLDLVQKRSQEILDREGGFGSTRNEAKDAILAARSGNMTGEGAYKALARGQSKLGNLPDPSTATEQLRQAGIPGIKYLDQGSRGAGAGTRNYVIFDDKLIDIVKKYGIAGLGAFPAGSHFLEQIDHDPFKEGRAAGGRVDAVHFKDNSEIGLAQNATGIHFQCRTCKYIDAGTCHNPNPELHGRKVRPHWCCNLYDHSGMKVIV